MRKLGNLKLFGLFLVLTSVLVFIGLHVLRAQVEIEGKPLPPNPLRFAPPNIVTNETDAVRVWKLGPDGSYNILWTMKTRADNYYSDVAVGDVDGDGLREIVAPVSIPVSKKPGGGFKIFLDVYKEGLSGIWKSTENYDPGYFLDESRVICDITVANVIPGDGLDEIILLHWYNLVIFQWDGINFSIKERIEGVNLPTICFFNGMTTKNFDTDDAQEEIFVSGQDTYFGTGYIYMIDVDSSGEYNSTLIASTGDFALGHSLRVANLDGNADLEICLPGLIKDRPADVSYWQACLLVLDKSRSDWTLNFTIISGYEEKKNVYPYLGMDVGDLDTDQGEEIALYVNQEQDSNYDLFIYHYLDGVKSIQNIADGIYDIKIGNVVGDGANQIVVCGRTNFYKYLEVFDSNLGSRWKYKGEKGKAIGDIAIVN